MKKMIKKMGIILLGLLVLCVIIVKVDDIVYEKYRKPDFVSYGEFNKDLKAHNIDTIYYNNGSEVMWYTLLNDETRKMSQKEKEDYDYDKSSWRETQYTATETFREDMLKYGVTLKIEELKFLRARDILPSIYVYVIFAMFLIVVLKWVMGITHSGSEIHSDTPDITFDDVIGHDEVIKDLKFVVEILKDKTGKYKDVKTPKGILFSGEPGTGKTLLAKAIAGECDIPFYSVNSSSLINKYVGVGANNVRALFKQARQTAPCIIFIDEIDSIGQTRADEARSGGDNERNQTLLALLQEIDGFKEFNNVFIIGATNRPETLDKALVRSDRLSREIVLNPPRDYKVRMQLLEYYLKDKEHTLENLEDIAKQMIGFTGADISYTIDEALINAVSNSRTEITMEDIEIAIDKKMLKGNRSKNKLSDHDIEITAYHEAGHAVMTHLVGQKIARISITGTTSGVGGMVMPVDKETMYQTRKGMEDQLKILYAGRCAEELKYGVDYITTGASSDIQKATELISSYTMDYGFNGVALNYKVLGRYCSTDKIVDGMNDFAKETYENTKASLRDNYDLVTKVAETLIKVETMTGDDFLELIN